MDTERMIKELENVAEKYRNKRVFTGEVNIFAMCGDVIPKIKQLKEYEDLEEQDLLLRLPCRIGDTLYHVGFKKKCHEYEEYGGYLINSDIQCIACELSDCTCGSKKEYFIEEIKATLPMIANLIEQPEGFKTFLTKSEAEEALKRMEGKIEID